MPINIQARFAFDLAEPTDVLLQFEAAIIPEQRMLSSDTWLTQGEHFARVPAQDDIGERIWLRAQGHCEVSYEARVAVERILTPIETLDELQAHELPGEAVQYLLDSRYCPSERFQQFVADDFGDLHGGAKIVALRDWIANHLTYEPGSSTPQTGALDTFVERRGICRDYAHLMVSLARAAAIPARYVSCFDPGVDPQDFHAVAEVFLADPEVPDGGAWHLVDATGMASADSIVKIGVGRDAADVSFLTTFGYSHFCSSEVQVHREDA